MSSREQAIAAVKDLQAKAKAGDVHAKSILRQLVAAARQQQAEAVLGHLDAGPDPVEDEINMMDDLDQADFVQRKFQHADELTQKVALRGANWKGLNEVAPFIRTNPPSVLTGQIGNQALCQGGNQAEPPTQAQVAFWGGLDAETHVVAVTLGVVNTPPVADAFDAHPRGIRPYGILQFGTRGFLQKVEVDIGQGTQFTVTASQCTLQVALEPNEFGRIPLAVQLSGMLSFHNLVHTTGLTRTRYFDQLNGNSALTTIPAFAKDVYFVNSDFTTIVTIYFYESSGLLCGQYIVPASTILAAPLLVPNDAQAFIVNTSKNENLRVMFGLTV